MRIMKFQEGGMAPEMAQQGMSPEAGAPMDAQGGMPAEGAPQGGEQDPIMMLAQASAQALQEQNCELAMQVCQAFLQLIQEAQGGAEAAPQGEPVFKKGGRICGVTKKKNKVRKGEDGEKVSPRDMSQSIEDSGVDPRILAGAAGYPSMEMARYRNGNPTVMRDPVTGQITANTSNLRPNELDQFWYDRGASLANEVNGGRPFGQTPEGNQEVQLGLRDYFRRKGRR